MESVLVRTLGGICSKPARNLFSFVGEVFLFLWMISGETFFFCFLFFLSFLFSRLSSETRGVWDFEMVECVTSLYDRFRYRMFSDSQSTYHIKVDLGSRKYGGAM